MVKGFSMGSREDFESDEHYPPLYTIHTEFYGKWLQIFLKSRCYLAFYRLKFIDSKTTLVGGSSCFK